MSFSNGRYRIKNKKSGTYFDIPPGGSAHGWQGYADNLNQQWDLEQANGGFRIKSAGTGKFVNTNGEPRDGSRVTTNDQARIWEIRHENNGWAIYAQGTGAVIDLDYGKQENGAAISVWGYSGADQQHWEFEQVGGGYGQQQQQQPQQQPQQQQQGGAAAQWALKNAYHGPIASGAYIITNALAGTALDLSGGKNFDGNEVIGWQNTRANNQTWIIESGQAGYRIKNAASGTYLGYPEAREGANVGGYNNARQFQVNIGQNNAYQFQASENTHLVLDLSNGVKHGQPVDGAKVVLWSNNNGENQFWKLEKVQ